MNRIRYTKHTPLMMIGGVFAIGEKENALSTNEIELMRCPQMKVC